MKKPTISILIPTYNYARYLPEAIESVLAQDFKDFELIISDNASSDDTIEVCGIYAKQDPRIRFFRQEHNLGMIGNWNWCLHEACGKYIKYLMADDKFETPFALRKLVEAIKQDSNISLVTSARALMNAESKTIGIWNPLGPRTKCFSGKKMIRECLMGDINLIGEPTAVLFRKKDALRGFDKDFHQLADLEMWFHLLSVGNLHYLPESLCFFRQHPDQQTVQSTQKNLHSLEMDKLNRRYLFFRYSKYEIFLKVRKLRKKGLDCQAELEYLEAHINLVEFFVFKIWYRLRKCIWHPTESTLNRDGKNSKD